MSGGSTNVSLMNNEIEPAIQSAASVHVERVPRARLFSYKRLVDLPQSTPFPKNLFSIREYNSWKVLALIVFASAVFSVGHAYLNPIVHIEQYTGPAKEEHDNQGWLKRSTVAIYEWAWQRTPPETKIKVNAEKQIAWGRRCASVGIVLAWLFVWLCFDWHNARTMIYGIFLIGFGVIYTVSPLDLVPDALPIFGVLDDAAMILFGSGLGLMSIIENAKKRKQDAYLREIMKENPSSAVSIVLKDYGLAIEDVHIAQSNDT